MGPHFENIQQAAVIDIDRRAPQPFAGVSHVLPLLARGLTGAQRLERHTPLGADQSLNELLHRHLEAEDRDRKVFHDRRVGGDVQRKARLSH
jgi:hypothetical protein